MDIELLIPYGVGPAGTLVRAAEADRQTEYHCPECSSVLVLRAGDIVIRHFAHKANTSCTGETIAHQTAKLLLAQVIVEQATSSDAKPITIACPCTRCQSIFQISLPLRSLTEARVEQRVGDFVCDVVALRGKESVLAIEILATHAVEERKAIELAIPWVELSAEQVLEDPYRWLPTNARLKPVLCRECKAYLNKLSQLAKRWNLPITESSGFRDPANASYLAAIETCWNKKCGEEIIVYWWRGVPFCEIEPPMPRPHTIQFRNSKAYGGAYWANTCPGCGVIQGDNVVFLGLNHPSPFKGLPLRELPQSQKQRKKAESQLVDAMFRNFDV